MNHLVALSCICIFATQSLHRRQTDPCRAPLQLCRAPLQLCRALCLLHWPSLTPETAPMKEAAFDWVLDVRPLLHANTQG